MSILGAIVVPHPPIILPDVGRGEEKGAAATVEAYRAAAKKAAELNPDVLIVTSPHTVSYSDYFHISPDRDAVGDMSAFGAPMLRFYAKYDMPMRAEIIRMAKAEGISAGVLGERDPKLDHGVCVPLYFLREAGLTCPIVRMGLSGFSALEHYRLGQCIAKAAENLGRRALFVASGDLSHKLKEDGPYGFAPEGPLFDSRLVSAMRSGNFLDFLSFDPNFCERAAECGLRSFQIMAGALDGLALIPEVLSYEGPFGVGYAVAVYTVSGKDKSRCFASLFQEKELLRLKSRKDAEDPYVKLARLSLETYILTGKRLDALPEGLPDEMVKRAAGAFVSLHMQGQLRGCIGTIGPTRRNVAEEIVQNAVSAGTQDPRFSPVLRRELDFIEYSVDVLGESEPVSGPGQLDPKRYGVIVSCKGRRGLLLPDLEGVETVEEQISIARRKGGIGPKEHYTLERFEVVRHV